MHRGDQLPHLLTFVFQGVEQHAWNCLLRLAPREHQRIFDLQMRPEIVPNLVPYLERLLIRCNRAGITGVPVRSERQLHIQAVQLSVFDPKTRDHRVNHKNLEPTQRTATMRHLSRSVHHESEVSFLAGRERWCHQVVRSIVSSLRTTVRRLCKGFSNWIGPLLSITSNSVDGILGNCAGGRRTMYSTV